MAILIEPVNDVIPTSLVAWKCITERG